MKIVEHTYKKRHGVDWDPNMSDILIDLTVAKKHREYESEYGITFKDPWVPMIDAARALVSKDYFTVSPWTEEHFHDYVVFQEAITWGCGSSSKSNDFGLLSVLDWITDPYATVTIIGSTTKVDLRLRIWEAVVRYHSAIRNNDKGFTIPGVASEVGFMISNEKDEDSPESAGKKSAILGRALNEDGRLIGAHLPYVRVIVDELATISNYDAIDQGLSNLSIGARDFRFYGLANPKSWDDPSCKYCLPEAGVEVNVDTGSWTSTRGIFVRHHDGLKSPAYLNPELSKKYPYLMSRKQVESNLRRVDGNSDAPLFWEQTRGFPLAFGSAVPTVLDPLVASANGCGSPPPAPFSGERTPIGLAGGADPAWSEGGDDAIYQGVNVFEQDGKVYLDFSGRTRKIPVSATSKVPVTQQQRDFVLNEIRAAGGPEIDKLAVDSSGNQGLSDAISMSVGMGLLAVNNSNSASAAPLKRHDPTPANTLIRDRGTESWMVLAEFCRAGQAFGLPQGALSALVQRRFALRPKSSEPVTPLRLEAKEEFAKRFKGSPNEADACALAALAVKERLGVMPFGTASSPRPEGIIPEAYGTGRHSPPPLPVPDSDYGSDSCDGCREW